MSFFRVSDLKGRRIKDGVDLKSVWGENVMVTFFEFEPDSSVPSHSHEHEQITYVLEGELEFSLNGEKRILKAGDGVVVPADAEHSAVVLGKPSRVMDAWYPVREDYKI